MTTVPHRCGGMPRQWQSSHSLVLVCGSLIPGNTRRRKNGMRGKPFKTQREGLRTRLIKAFSGCDHVPSATSSRLATRADLAVNPLSDGCFCPFFVHAPEFFPRDLLVNVSKQNIDKGQSELTGERWGKIEGGMDSLQQRTCEMNDTDSAFRSVCRPASDPTSGLWGEREEKHANL